MIILEQVCEAIYFSLFMILGKNLRQKRILFTCIMIFEYVLITRLIQFNIWIHVLYIIMTYINLKVLYKEKAQITDIFLFGAASIILIAASIVCYAIVYFTVRQYMVALILNRIVIFGLLFLLRNKLNKIYQKFYKSWNRHNDPNKVKSLTLRNISTIIFNLMFWIINTCMAFSYILNS